MKYRAIISDFDGTLVYQKAKISSKVREAVRMYINAGGKFCLATGRDYAGDIVAACKELDLDTPQITSGGAEIVEPRSGQVLVGHYLDASMARLLLDELCQLDLTLIVSQQRLLYTQRPDSLGYYQDLVRPLSEITSAEIPRIRLTMQPHQVRLFKPLLDELVSSHPQQMVIHQSNTIRSTGFDITSPKATKHLAVLEVSKLLSIDPRAMAGMGDGYNDYPLLTACGYKVAMDTAPSELQEIADYIAPAEGAATAIEHIWSLG